MFKQIDKTQASNSRAVANAVAQKQRSGNPNSLFVDNRREVVAQRRWQAMADNSLKMQQGDAFQEMANKNPKPERAAQLEATGSTIQRMTYVLPEETGGWRKLEPTAEEKKQAKSNKQKMETRTDRSLHLAAANLAGHTPICNTADEVGRVAQKPGPASRELHIYAHGNQQMIGTYDVGGFHAHLKQECKVNDPERRTHAIILHTCMSANVHEKTGPKSIASRLHALEMAEGWAGGTTKGRSGQVVVVGYKSKVFTDSKGASRCLKPAFWNEEQDWDTLYTQLLGKLERYAQDKRYEVENYYLMPESESRVVYEVARREENPGKEKHEDRARFRQVQGKEFTFDTGSAVEGEPTEERKNDKQLKEDLKNLNTNVR